MNPEQQPQIPNNGFPPQQPNVVGPQMPDSSMPPITPASKSKKKLIIVIVVALVVIGLGVGAYFVFASKEDPTPTTSLSTTESNQEQQPTAEAENKTLTLTDENGTTISLDYPSSWKTEGDPNTPNESGITEVSITSDQGIVVSLAKGGGVGGACPDDEYSYTLTHKFATATNNVYFTEYTTTNPQYPVRKFGLEDFSNRNPGNTTQEEGDEATNTCTLPAYPIIGNIYVSISKDNEQPTYDEVAKDPDLLNALATLTVTKQ
jgi:hypothetical protein